MLKEEFFQSLILQLEKHLFSLTFYFQGEPFLNPDFLKMVAFANQQGIYTITSTNAHYLNAETARATINSQLDELIISVDGSNQASYAKYRVGGQFEKVMEGTKHILEQKRLLKSNFPHVVWQFIVFKHNEAEINEIKQLGKKLGVDEVRIKTAQIYDYKNGGDWIPEDQKYSRYEKTDNGGFKIKNKLLNQCWRMWQGCVITWDGKVVPVVLIRMPNTSWGN
jgi:MoaA/NifB/PqqE/SkfB family radical SAM enzyme